MNGERSDHTEPSVAELWALLKQQQEEIAALKAELSAQKQTARPSKNGHEDTPAGIERQLSRAGLLKAAAVGVAGLTVVETADTIEAPSAAAASGELEYHSYVAS